MTTSMETLMDPTPTTRWTKTTEQGGHLEIVLDAKVVADLKLEDFATLLADQGWTREPEAAAFDRRSTCACTDVALADEDDPVESGTKVHHCILCRKIPAQS